MRNYEQEIKNRVSFIQKTLADANAKGVIYGNSGGKDCALVSILCRMATEHVLGVMMPCQSKRNYEQDMEDAQKMSDQFQIKNIVVDLTQTKNMLCQAIETNSDITNAASANIAPRLRMTTLYAIGQSMGYLVAGTGNKSELYMGYFTKWGDGGCDFNPIADLTATEVFEFLSFLNAPESIIAKAPSAGLYDGQTDEKEMGVTYNQIDQMITQGIADEKSIGIIRKAHAQTEHKRNMPIFYESVK